MNHSKHSPYFPSLVMLDVSHNASCKFPHASPTHMPAPLPIRPLQIPRELLGKAARTKGVLDEVEIKVDAEVV